MDNAKPTKSVAALSTSGASVENGKAGSHTRALGDPTPTPPSYFDVAAEEYTAAYSKRSPPGYALRVRQQRALEMLDTPGRLLDVGCGPATLAHDLLRAGFEVWGIDAARRMIDICRKQYAHEPRAHFAVGDATNLGFGDACVDTVICIGVLPRVQSQESALREMLRVVKPGGTLVISFPNLLSPYAAWKNFVFYPTVALLRPIYYGLFGKPQPPSIYTLTGRVALRGLKTALVTILTVRGLSKFIAGEGGCVTAVAYSNFNVFLSPLDEMMPSLALRVTRRLEALRPTSLRWLGTDVIFKLTKLA